MSDTPDIRRTDDGCIDHRFYTLRGRALHGDTIRRALADTARALGHIPRRLPLSLGAQFRQVFGKAGL